MTVSGGRQVQMQDAFNFVDSSASAKLMLSVAVLSA